LEGTHHPVGSPLGLQDYNGLLFAAQRDGSVRGVMLTLTAAMVAGNACTVRILKNGSQLGVDTVTSSLVATTFRYLCSFNGAAMAFSKGDSIQIQLAFDVGQAAAIVGKCELLYLYE
jgi:hypothetical protein